MAATSSAPAIVARLADIATLDAATRIAVATVRDALAAYRRAGVG